MNYLRSAFFQHSVARLAALLFLGTTQLYAAPMEEVQFVDVDGVRTGYVEGGSGETMVLVHGGGFGSAAHFSNNFRAIFDDLTPHFHVYVIDKLGQGYTDNPIRDADYTMLGVAHHIYRFMETLGLQKVHLAGHSRGALPSLRIAADHPEMIETLTIYDSNTLNPATLNPPSQTTSAPTQPPPAAPPTPTQPQQVEPPTPTKESIREFWVSRLHHKDSLTDAFVEEELRVSLLPKFREASEKMRSLTAQWVENNPEKMAENPRSRGGWWIDDMKRETYSRVKAGRLKAPTLIIWGFNDPGASYTIGIEIFNIISAVVDRTELHLFNQSMHYVFQEYPQEISDLMVSFIGNSKD